MSALVTFVKKSPQAIGHLRRHGATVLIGLMEKSHKHKGFERSINSINLKIK